MAVKLIQYWNVMSGKQESFDAFFTGRFVPEIDALGSVKITASWLVASGEGPCFIAEGVSDSTDGVAALVTSDRFVTLRRELLGLVQDYNTKLLLPTGRVPEQSSGTRSGYKFNRHFNINAADYYACDELLTREYFPVMAAFGLQMVGDWTVGIGATPYVISECRAEDLSAISRMLQSPENQALTMKLLSMVTSYGCKVLVPSGHLNP